ncbi:YggT family protein [Marinisporobacter balticus]|uniref:YggT family protein n=1 Tax=Marinisporobacter balticus TaxID=2018667 RepID=A0A4R2L0C7_9FIRM|nr:YggT family protein [Marinisporobacter balticus]TCO78962.1 YggT family protein [Marinisporobacter balticus]
MWIMKVSVAYFFKVLDFLIIARILLSWLNPNFDATIPKLIYQLTEPILAPFRNLLFRFGLARGMIDFSPILAVLVLDFVGQAIVRLL